MPTGARPDARPDVRTDARPDLAALALFSLLVVLAALPYLALAYPPYQDFPGHAAMLAIRERLPGSPFLQQYFQRESILGPYAVFLGLGHALSPLVGPEWALRIVGALGNCGLPCVVLLARRWLHDRTWWGAGFLTLCLSLGFITAQGLMSFLFGLAAFALALVRWATVIAAREPPPPRWQGQLAALAALTFLAHGFAFLLLLLCVGITLVIERPGWRRLLRVWSIAPALALLVAIYLRDRGLYPPDISVGLVEYRSLLAKLQMLFLPTTFSRLGVDTAVGALLWLLLGWSVVHLLRTRGGEATSEDAAGPRAARVLLGRTAVVLFALSLLGPKRFDFFGSLDIRLAAAAILVAVLAVVPASPERPRWLSLSLRVGPPALASAAVATLLVAAIIFQGEAGTAVPVLQRIPAHSRVLYLPVQPYSRAWAAMPFFHFEKRLLFAGGGSDVLVGNVWLHQGTALRPTALGLPLLTVTPEATLDSEVPWDRYDVRPWDFVLVRNARERPPLNAPASLQLLTSSGGWHLFRNPTPAAPTAPPAAPGSAPAR